MGRLRILMYDWRTRTWKEKLNVNAEEWERLRRLWPARGDGAVHPMKRRAFILSMLGAFIGSLIPKFLRPKPWKAGYDPIVAGRYSGLKLRKVIPWHMRLPADVYVDSKLANRAVYVLGLRGTDMRCMLTTRPSWHRDYCTNPAEREVTGEWQDGLVRLVQLKAQKMREEWADPVRRSEIEAERRFFHIGGSVPAHLRKHWPESSTVHRVG